MSTLQALQRAKALLLTGGWQQGASGPAGGPHCIGAAVVDAIGLYEKVDGKFSPTTAQLQTRDAAFSRLNEVTWGSFISWNDAPGRTKEEVLSALDQAIALEEAA